MLKLKLFNWNNTNDKINSTMSFSKKVNIGLAVLLVTGVTSVYAASNDTPATTSQVKALQTEVDSLGEQVINLKSAIDSMRTNIAMSTSATDKLNDKLENIDFSKLNSILGNNTSGSGNSNTGNNNTGTDNNEAVVTTPTQGNPPVQTQQTKVQVQAKIDTENQRHASKMKEINDWYKEWTTYYNTRIAENKVKYPNWADYKGDAYFNDVKAEYQKASDEYQKNPTSVNRDKYQNLYKQYKELEDKQSAYWWVYGDMGNLQQIEIKYTQDVNDENTLHDKNMKVLNDEMAKAI